MSYNNNNNNRYQQPSGGGGFPLTQTMDSMMALGAGFPAHAGMPAGAPQFGSSSSSAASARRPARGGDQTVRPVSVRQLLAAANNDSVFSIDGAEVALVTVVALVTSAKMLETYTSVEIADGSGSIEARMFLSKADDGASAPSESALRPHSYVRVFGSMSAYGNVRCLRISTASAVTDYNEVIMHMSDVVLHHLQRTSKPQHASLSAAGGTSYASGSSGSGAGSGAAHEAYPKSTALAQGYGAHASNQPQEYNQGGARFQSGWNSGQQQSIGDPIGDAMLQVMRKNGCRENQTIIRHALYEETKRVVQRYLSTPELDHAVEILINKNYIYTSGSDDEFSLV